MLPFSRQFVFNKCSFVDGGLKLVLVLLKIRIILIISLLNLSEWMKTLKQVFSVFYGFRNFGIHYSEIGIRWYYGNINDAKGVSVDIIDFH